MDTSDTFLNSMNTGFALGHQMEQEKRLQQAQQMQMQEHQMRMQKLSGELQQQDFLNNPESPKYKPITDMLKKRYGDDYIQLRQAGISHKDIVNQKQISTFEGLVVQKYLEAEKNGVEISPVLMDLYNKIKGRTNEPYKVGQILPSRDSGTQHITQQVKGYDEKGMPILETIDTAPRYKPDSGGVSPQEKQIEKEKNQTVARLRTFQLKNYLQPNKDRNITEGQKRANEQESLKVEALISGIQDGSVDYKTIKYPTVIENGRLVQKNSQSGNLEKEAMEAIAKGADPKKVRARLKELQSKGM